MNIKALFDDIHNGNPDAAAMAQKNLGQIHRSWVGTDTHTLLTETVEREINRMLDVSPLESGMEQNALFFGYIKGLRSVLVSLKTHELEAERIVEEEKKRHQEDEEIIADYHEGSTGGPDSGVNSIVQ